MLSMATMAEPSKCSHYKRLRDDDTKDNDAGGSCRRAAKVPKSIDHFLISFLRLFEDETLKSFLYMDSFCKIADRYLLAMVYVYFRRVGLAVEQ